MASPWRVGRSKTAVPTTPSSHTLTPSLSLSLSHTHTHTHRIYSPSFKMEVYLRIARLYLEEADHVSAEAYINRAGMLQSEVQQNKLHVIYRVSSHFITTLAGIPDL